MSTHNAFAIQAAQTFLSECERLLQVDPATGELKREASRLKEIQDWFNGCHVWITMLTALPLAPVQFRLDGGSADGVTLLHVAAVSRQAAGLLAKRPL